MKCLLRPCCLFIFFVLLVTSSETIFPLQEVREHVVYVDDIERWWGEVYAGAPNPGGAVQGPKLEAGLAHPAGPGRMCFLRPGEAFIAGQGIVFRLQHETVSFFAGSPQMTGYQDGPAAGALFGQEISICSDGRGGLYVADRSNRCIRRIHQKDNEWVVSTIAGDLDNPPSQHLIRLVRDESPDPKVLQTVYDSRKEHDGIGKEVTFSYLHSNVIADRDGNAYVMDADYLRRIEPTGRVQTLNPEGGTGNPGPDGEALNSAHFRLLMKSGMCFGKGGSIYVADRWNHCVRRVDLSNRTVVTVIGPGRGYVDGPSGSAGFHDSPGHILYDPFRERFNVNGVDDWGLRVLEGGSMKTLAGGIRNNRALEGPAPQLGFHWGGTHSIDPVEPHAIYFWSNQAEWRGRIGRLFSREGPKQTK